VYQNTPSTAKQIHKWRGCLAIVNLPLSDRRIKLFLEGKGGWLEEGLLVPVKKRNLNGGL
jgi:hypothetical protein